MTAGLLIGGACAFGAAHAGPTAPGASGDASAPLLLVLAMLGLAMLGIAGASARRLKIDALPTDGGTPLFTDDIHDLPVISDVSYYLLVGMDAQRRIADGERFEAVCDLYRLSTHGLSCAVLFASSPPAVVFQALAENWTWSQIQRAMLDVG